MLLSIFTVFVGVILFSRQKTVKIQSLSYCYESCALSLKRIKILKDNTILIIENTYDSFTIHHFDNNGSEINKWSITDTDGILMDYLYINGIMYLCFISSVSEYEEELRIYRSNGSEFELVDAVERESYQHDMVFFSLFGFGKECRLMLIRHNRVHLYNVSDCLEEISVIEGVKWIICGEYAINVVNDEWEIYNSLFDLEYSFRFKSDIDWVDLSFSSDKSIMAAAANNSESDISALLIYDKKSDTYSVHYQKYCFYSLGVVANKIWTTVVSNISGLGGLMIFDKSASLKFAHLRDESEMKTYNPEPLIYQAYKIHELMDNKVLMSSFENLIVTDITCKVLQIIDYDGVDTYSLSDTSDSLVLLKLNKLDVKDEVVENYEAEIEFYQWGNEDKDGGKVIDLTPYI